MNKQEYLEKILTRIRVLSEKWFFFKWFRFRPQLWLHTPEGNTIAISKRMSRDEMENCLEMYEAGFRDGLEAGRQDAYHYLTNSQGDYPSPPSLVRPYPLK
jgi:hypothetical protein